MQPLRVKKTCQRIRHPNLSCFVEELQLPPDSETLGRSNSKPPASERASKQSKASEKMITFFLQKRFTCDAAVPARDGANPPYNLSHPSCFTTFKANSRYKIRLHRVYTNPIQRKASSRRKRKNLAHVLESSKFLLLPLQIPLRLLARIYLISNRQPDED